MFKINGFIAFMGCFICSPLLFAASFDCSQSTTLVEQSVCTNKQLSDLDDLVGVAYKNALSRTSNQNTIKTKQRQWLQSERNICQNILCLKKSYLSRLSELKQNILISENGEVTVPENQKWIIESFAPYDSEYSSGKADLYFQGVVLIDGKYSISGKYEIVLDSSISAPIVVYGGTKIKVGDYRFNVAVSVEFEN